MSTGVKILVAEHSPDNALAMARTLRGQGWKVISCSDVAQTLSTAIKERPDAIVMSTQLPGGDAVILIKRLRSLAHTAVIPIIAIRQHKGPNKQNIFDAGAQECLDPPVDVTTLCAAIRKQVGAPPVVKQAPADILENPERLQALKQTELLDTAPDESLDRITWLITRMLKVPTALVSLVDKNRQFFKSQVGLPDKYAKARQTPLSHSFCQWVVTGKQDVTVTDARDHSLFQRNMALRDLNVIAYAGVPLATTSGEVIGSLCAINSTPHQWTRDDVELLHELADVAEACIAANPVPPRNLDERMEILRAEAKGVSAATRILQQRWRKLTEGQCKALLVIIDHHSKNMLRLTGEKK